MELHVKHTSDCYHSYRDDRDGEPYNYEWEDSYSHKVHGVYLEKPKRDYDYETFEVDFTVERGDIVFVLTMVYSSGDSFGRSHGNHEVIWVFKDAECAHKAARKIENNSEDFTVSIKVESGKKVKMSNPGAGYFESVQSMDVDSFRVE